MSGYVLTRDQHIWCGRNDYMEGHEVSEIKTYIISAMLVLLGKFTREEKHMQTK